MTQIKASPSVRAQALQKGIDIEAHARALGRTTIGMEDLEAVARPQTGSDMIYWDVDHSEYGEIERAPLGKINRIASDNLSAAHRQIPSVTHHEEVSVEAVEAFRRAIKAEMTFRGQKITSLAFFVMALSRALKAFQKFNASLSANGEEIIFKKYVHIGIAVDTPNGLMVPVVRDADKMGLWDIANTISELAKRAQARKIRPHEMGGASMTVSNLGGIGGSGFTPIVNPPEVAILGMTKTKMATVWEDGVPRAVPVVPIDLTYDHRVINGADAARFCEALRKMIADPRHLLV